MKPRLFIQEKFDIKENNIYPFQNFKTILGPKFNIEMNVTLK